MLDNGFARFMVPLVKQVRLNSKLDRLNTQPPIIWLGGSRYEN
jgi:hypothetical protein